MTDASRLTRALLAAAVAAGLTACGVHGTAIPGEIDVRTLDTGAYPVTQHHYDSNSGGNGALLEGMRMSEALPTGVRIDPTQTVGRNGGVTVDAQDAEDGSLAVGSGPVLTRNDMVVGYDVDTADALDPDGQDFPAPTTTSITNLLLRFPSESAAKVAARELEDVDFAYAPDQNRRLNLSEYPDAYIHWRPNIANIGAFLPYRQFVLSLFIQRPHADSTDLLNWVRKTLDASVAVLDKFTPTPSDKLDTLKVDPDHLLARMVTRDRDSHTPDPNTFAVYGPSSFINTSHDETLTTRQLTDTGVDRVAVLDTSTLLRARDPAAATALLEGLTTTLGTTYNPTAALDKVPSTQCFKRGNADTTYAPYRCYVAYNRYVAIVNSDSESDIKQKAAAQYALLANSL